MALHDQAIGRQNRFLKQRRTYVRFAVRGLKSLSGILLTAGIFLYGNPVWSQTRESTERANTTRESTTQKGKREAITVQENKPQEGQPPPGKVQGGKVEFFGPNMDKPETASRTLEFYGQVALDYIQDFKRVNPDWKDTLRPSKIPTVPGIYGEYGEAIFSVRQTRVGIRGNTDAKRWPVDFRIEFDFFGVGTTAGKPTPNLRFAYAQYGPFVAGQGNSVFMDPDTFPRVLDKWGPNGLIAKFNPQIRWTPPRARSRQPRNSFAIALEGLSQSLDVGTFSSSEPDLALNLNSVTRIPDITAHYRMFRGWGHVFLGGVYRQLTFETGGAASTGTPKAKGAAPGWGVNFCAEIKKGGANRLLLSAVTGQGIGNYFNDAVQDLAPNTTDGSTAHAAAIPARGLTAYYDHNWNAALSSSVGFSHLHLDNVGGQTGDAFNQGDYASANIRFSPEEKLVAGAEFLWGRRRDFSGATGTDYRIQFSVRYAFVTKL